MAGANYSAWLIKKYLLNESVNFYDSWEENLFMLRYDGEVIIRNAKL